jgi:N-acetylglucosaminyl-diphospho-decaprenol L-rhamnosyltransferase
MEKIPLYKNILLTVIIITYNNKDQILPCLHSLPWSEIPMELFLIDNGSQDGTCEILQNIALRNKPVSLITIFNSRNNGFASGVNRSLTRSRGDYILLLGPDTRLRTHAISILMKYLKENPEVGLIAPQLLNTAGQIQPSCRRFPSYKDVFLELTGLPRRFPHRFTPSWKMPDFDHRTTREVDQPEATCLLTHPAAQKTVGLMDEDFPIFFNDVDWCRRFIEKGWKIVYHPDAHVIHEKGSSVRQDTIPMIWKSHQGFYRYFKKYKKRFFEKGINLFLGFLLIYTALIRSLGCQMGIQGLKAK